jgi:outer membrane protein TolC
LKQLEDLAEAARRAAGAARSGYWPRLQAMARASYDYPNGPILEQVQQDTVGVSATWPLFSFGQTGHQVAEQERTVESLEARGRLARTELDSSWQKSRSRLSALKARDKLDAQAVEETRALYRLVTGAYRNGGLRYLEVETALLKLLDARTRLALTETQMLIELAGMASLRE